MPRFAQLLEYVLDGDGQPVLNPEAAPFTPLASESSPPSLNESSPTLTDETPTVLYTSSSSSDGEVRTVSPDASTDPPGHGSDAEAADTPNNEPWRERYIRARQTMIEQYQSGPVMIVRERFLQRVLYLYYESWCLFCHSLPELVIIFERLHALEHPEVFGERIPIGLLLEARKVLSWPPSKIRLMLQHYADFMEDMVDRFAEIAREDMERLARISEEIYRQRLAEEERNRILYIEEGKKLHEELMETTLHHNPHRANGYQWAKSVPNLRTALDLDIPVMSNTP